jgi:lipopolysaccharide biosynthesis regulator YciM
MASVLALFGCSKRDDGRIEVVPPKEAASALEQAFQSAPAPVQDNVRLVSDAMRRGEYDKAVLSLQAVKQQSANVNVDQGMALHGAVVSMESQLIQAIQSGDPNAARAYELLRAMKRN